MDNGSQLHLSGLGPQHVGPDTLRQLARLRRLGRATSVRPIDGTVVPTGPGGSLEFTPRQSIDALKYMKQTFGAGVYKKYGLVDSFNPLSGFTSALVLGIDVGMTLISAENARSNFVWNYFNQTSVARQSLASAFPSIAPQLITAASRKTNPSSVVRRSAAQSQRNPQRRESRRRPTQLVLTFDENIVKGEAFRSAKRRQCFEHDRERINADNQSHRSH